jgi:hypothetical protein
LSQSFNATIGLDFDACAPQHLEKNLGEDRCRTVT